MTRVAVIADIHSNADALRAVLDDAAEAGTEVAWVAGDVFGYGLAACATWDLLCGMPNVTVLGNHDWWVMCPSRAPAGATGDGARANAAELAAGRPGALNWLACRPPAERWPCGGWRVTMCHGTPDDPLGGRYYPDDRAPYPWLPRPGEILILGQTHYPLLRGTAATGMLLNPGSVGQPRDGDARPAWALLDTDAGTAGLRRAEAPAGVPA